ncbi:glutathione S-transferase family protein [Pseudogulbenkiania ferrooxidans]|uniref:Glutathione S-transferase domain protein n=1 Tax=Pseudogulbenkiania ferrooxidans 2002 TaxID=279714 RepID=B9YZ19_9NEIS|nr:glutathione S-transferase family protein [Pseudogulbenkiania ferrooxidans]EEG10372.1 Glutathione S-transferase domain protein [Pseudogulbenkiania ferrooxidans 2002]
MSTLTLYGNRFSGHSYKVRLALMLGDVSHEYRHVDLAAPRAERPDDFRAASRWDEVPALVVDGVPMVQSNAILQWLAESEGVLAGRPGERQGIREWLGWEANRIGLSVPNLRYYRRFASVPAEVEAWLELRACADLAVLDAQLAQQPFLLESGVTIADLSASAYLWWLDEAGLSVRDWPHVAAWLERLAALPGWQHPDQLMAPDIPD